MKNVLIVGILLAIILLAALCARKYFKDGAYCGSGGNVVRDGNP